MEHSFEYRGWMVHAHPFASANQFEAEKVGQWQWDRCLPTLLHNIDTEEDAAKDDPLIPLLDSIQKSLTEVIGALKNKAGD